MTMKCTRPCAIWLSYIFTMIVNAELISGLFSGSVAKDDRVDARHNNNNKKVEPKTNAGKWRASSIMTSAAFHDDT